MPIMTEDLNFATMLIFTPGPDGDVLKAHAVAWLAPVTGYAG